MYRFVIMQHHLKNCDLWFGKHTLLSFAIKDSAAQHAISHSACICRLRKQDSLGYSCLGDFVKWIFLLTPEPRMTLHHAGTLEFHTTHPCRYYIIWSQNISGICCRINSGPYFAMSTWRRVSSYTQHSPSAWCRASSCIWVCSDPAAHHAPVMWHVNKLGLDQLPSISIIHI